MLLRNESQLWRIKDLINNFRLVYVDLSDQEKLNQAFIDIKPEVVYHLAAYGAYPYRNGIPYQQNVNQMIEVNIQGTINLIRSAAQANVRQFINAGSSSEYGVKESPMSEDDLLFPTDIYGATKASSYLIGLNLAQQLHLPFQHIRLFSVYGDYEEMTRLIPTVIINHLINQPLKLANPNSVRDFIYIKDVVDGLVYLGNRYNIERSIINLGTGIQSSVQDVVTIVKSNAKYNPEIHWRSIGSNPNEPHSWVANLSKLSATGFRAKYSLTEGLASALQWFGEHLDLYSSH